MGRRDVRNPELAKLTGAPELHFLSVFLAGYLISPSERCCRQAQQQTFHLGNNIVLPARRACDRQSRQKMSAATPSKAKNGRGVPRPYTMITFASERSESKM
jgi:hypothetical protein